MSLDKGIPPVDRRDALARIPTRPRECKCVDVAPPAPSNALRVEGFAVGVAFAFLCIVVWLALRAGAGAAGIGVGTGDSGHEVERGGHSQ